MDQEYHETVSSTDTRPLGPYESIVRRTPPIQLVLNAICDNCAIGGSITPGIRRLGEWSGVTLGFITDCLRTLDEHGWIAYDGRVITLLRDPNEDGETDRSADRSPTQDAEEVIDQLIDHPHLHNDCDRSADRSPLLAAVRRAQTRIYTDVHTDRSPDRSVLPPTPPMEDHDLVTTADSVAVLESPTMGGCGGDAANDRSPDRSHPVAQVMAELGAHPRIIADALAARDDWTPQQVRDRWSYDQERIAQSAGRLTEGVFFEALRAGQLAPPRGSAVDWSAYATDDEPEEESLHAHARRILPDGGSGKDFQFVLMRLGQGDSDADALAALAASPPRTAGRGGRR